MCVWKQSLITLLLAVILEVRLEFSSYYCCYVSCHITPNHAQNVVDFLYFRPFSGKHLRQKGDGLYTCVVCDNALFRSDQKFDSMCGWPAFSDVIAQGKVTLKKDMTHGEYTKL